MSELPRNSHEFTIERVGFIFSDETQRRVSDYIRELIDSYNAAEVLATIENPDLPTTEPTFKPGFTEKHDVYIVKESIVGWFDGEELEVDRVTYPGQEGHDNPELRLGPVDLATGKLIVTFDGLHFRTEQDESEAANDDGFYKTYGFIYDPSAIETETTCLVSEVSDLETADKMVDMLSDSLLGR